MLIAEDVLKLLKRDTSNRAVHYACLKANPFCKESETLQDGVKRLDAWLDISVKLNHRSLNQILVVVLACFGTIEPRVTSVKELNGAWLAITRDVVSPCATIIDAQLLKNARKIAVCVLYLYMPTKYASQMLAIRPKECTYNIRVLLEELQRVELAERARLKIVKLVSSAIQNVLNMSREETRVQQRRAKKMRRKRIQSTELVVERHREREKHADTSASAGVSVPSYTLSDPWPLSAVSRLHCVQLTNPSTPPCEPLGAVAPKRGFEVALRAAY